MNNDKFYTIENPIYTPDEKGRYKFLISCKKEKDIVDVFKMLVDPYQGNNSLSEKIECYDYMYDDNYSCVFLLTPEQKEELLKDDRIVHIANYPLP